MTEPLKKNSDTAIGDHLARAREHYQRGTDCYIAAAEEIDAALSIDPELPYRDIADAMGIRSHTTVKRLYDWWKSGADRTDPPFGGEDASNARNARAARQALRERPEVVLAELLKDPKAARQFERQLQKGIAALKPPPAKEPPPPSKELLFIPLRDHIVMGQHVLFVGDSANTYFKRLVLRHIGVAQDEVPDSYRIESGLVVVTDPPYGQHQPGVPGDGSADHSSVYNMLKPRGGFSFCAYRPPLFRQAEEGIEKADGVPVHYLAMRTKSALGQGPEGRLRNLLQAIIYWERRGEKPWIQGREAVSVLEADQQAREEMTEVRKQHTTPKPVDVMEYLIDRVTEEGDFVLDPFAGSGSTLIACERTNRRFIGFEGNGITDSDRKKWQPHPYAEVTVQRWENEPGNKGKAVVHRANADPPTMLFEELVAKGWPKDSRWPDEVREVIKL